LTQNLKVHVNYVLLNNGQTLLNTVPAKLITSIW